MGSEGSKADREENHQGDERQQHNVTAAASGVPLGNAEQQQQQPALERDLERVASDMSERALIGVTVRSNNGDVIRQLSVRPSQNIRDSIVEAFSCHPAQVEAVEFGGEAVEEGATYEDYGVEVGQPSFVRPSGLGLVSLAWHSTGVSLCACVGRTVRHSA